MLSWPGTLGKVTNHCPFRATCVKGLLFFSSFIIFTTFGFIYNSRTHLRQTAVKGQISKERREERSPCYHGYQGSLEGLEPSASPEPEDVLSYFRSNVSRGVIHPQKSKIVNLLQVVSYN